MTKRTKQVVDLSIVERYPTVNGFEVVLRKAPHAAGPQYWQVMLRSVSDETKSHTILLTDKKHIATKQIMAFHAGACAMQRISMMVEP